LNFRPWSTAVMPPLKIIWPVATDMSAATSYKLLRNAIKSAFS
jgi:hypothetical protein